ncbi:DNA-binding protein [Sulfurimonas sp. SAG-AH-194-I05]|nr:CopG family transcriptional regulator [Sulfurimonas sp. SAG-AH-194-I05]MDF1875765.1 DNA-binding protein [Sulfurimonas sp. SAG-AH-194-I05]
MKTITLKTDDVFFENITALAKRLNLTKSELIRRSVKEYESFIKKQMLKNQIKQASLKVREHNQIITKEFDSFSHDGLENV